MARAVLERERDVEEHLKLWVKYLGGEVRKVAWVNRRHAPDRYVMLPNRAVWVELKRPTTDASEAQAREHQRLRNAGQDVVVLRSKKAVNEWGRTIRDSLLQRD